MPWPIPFQVEILGMVPTFLSFLNSFLRSLHSLPLPWSFLCSVAAAEDRHFSCAHFSSISGWYFLTMQLTSHFLHTHLTQRHLCTCHGTLLSAAHTLWAPGRLVMPHTLQTKSIEPGSNSEWVNGWVDGLMGWHQSISCKVREVGIQGWVCPGLMAFRCH